MRRIGRHHARRQWIRWAAGGGALLTALAAMALFAATSQPGWYQPATVGPAEYAAIRNEVPNFGSDIGTYLQRGQPFRIVIQDKDINRWIAARDAIWPGLGTALPEHLSNPMVAFEPGRIVLGIQYQGKGIASVLSLGVNLQMETNGGAIHVRVDRLRAGYLPVPRMLVDGAARKALDREASRHLNSLMRHIWSQAGEYLPASDLASNSRAGNIPLAAMLGDIWEFRLPTRSRWPNGGFPYSISNLRIEQGRLMIDVVPTPRQATQANRASQPDA